MCCSLPPMLFSPSQDGVPHFQHQFQDRANEKSTDFYCQVLVHSAITDSVDAPAHSPLPPQTHRVTISLLTLSLTYWPDFLCPGVSGPAAAVDAGGQQVPVGGGLRRLDGQV